MSEEIAWLSAEALADGFRRRELSPVEVLQSTLVRLEQFNDRLNAFEVLDPEAAFEAAQESEARWMANVPLGPLDGIPTSLKDLVLAKGWPTRHGSLAVDQGSDEDSPPAARLREGGAVLIGKTTTPEFGWKALTDSPLSGITRNPWNTALSPGGSSGGAAASVAAGITAVAHGTDGGGSIRIPAAHCALVGFKPTWGRVPAWPNDSAYAAVSTGGPLARTVRDAALLLQVLAQPDARDWNALPHDPRNWLAEIEDGVAGLRIGVSLDLGKVEAEPEIVAAVQDAAALFATLGAKVEPVGPLIAPLQRDFGPLWLAGFAARLRQIPPDRWDLLDPGFRAAAEEGLGITLPAYEAAHAAKVRLGAQLQQWHQRHDLLLTPTSPVAAPPVETRYNTPDFPRWTKGAPYTLPFNLTGQPAASVPCGLTADGRPIGLQIVGAKYMDALVLRAARAFEEARGFPQPHSALRESLDRIG